MKYPRWKFILVWICFFVLCCWVTKECTAQTLPLAYAKHKSYEVYYSMENKCPAFVVYDLCLADFAGTQKVATHHFKKDTKLPRPWVKDDDYKNSGYVRGHLCAAGDRDSDKAKMKDTYYCSNIVPMPMIINSGPWRKAEEQIRQMCRPDCSLVVAAWPIFMNSDTTFIGQHRVRVPSSMVKVARCRIHPNEMISVVANFNDGTMRPYESDTYSSTLQNILDERVKLLFRRYFEF